MGADKAGKVEKSAAEVTFEEAARPPLSEKEHQAKAEHNKAKKDAMGLEVLCADGCGNVLDDANTVRLGERLQNKGAAVKATEIAWRCGCVTKDGCPALGFTRNECSKGD